MITWTKTGRWPHGLPNALVKRTEHALLDAAPVSSPTPEHGAKGEEKRIRLQRVDPNARRQGNTAPARPSSRVGGGASSEGSR